MNPNGRQNLKRFFVWSNLGILLSLALAISLLFLGNYRQATHAHYQKLREEILRSKREFIKDAVDRTIQHIEQERALCSSGRHGSCGDPEVKERLREHIRAVRLKDDGYIWVNAVVNYAGGDNYAYRFVHPNLPETEGMMLSTSLRDIKGNSPYLTELEGVKKNGEIFFDYWFKKMNSDQIQHKLTYAKLYQPYDWIVATGVYLDDVDQIVQSGMARWEAGIRSNVLFALAFTGIASLLAWGLSLLVGKRVDTLYNFFLHEVEKREKAVTLLNLELEKRVEERTSKIAASEKKYLDLYENAPDMYLSTDAATGVIVQCNATLATVVGRAREEIVGQGISDIFPPDCAAEIRQAFAQGEIHDREFSLHRQDGSRLEISLSVSAAPDENGALRYRRATLRDISERKRLEDTLRFIAQRGWLDHAEDFLTALAAYLGDTLAVDYIIIDRLAADAPGFAETVALYAKGALLPSLRYPLSHTPCENVMGKSLCYYPRGVQSLFPADPLLAEMGVESYAGVPLWDSEGNALGLIAVMDSKPFGEGTSLVNILQLVATSAAAALERELVEENIRLHLAQQKALLKVYLEMPKASIREIIAHIVDNCVHLTGSVIGFVGLISEDEQRMEAHIWSEKAMLNCPLDKPLDFPLSAAGLWAEPIRQGRTIIINDFSAPNPLKKGYPEGHLELLRFLGVPVIDKGRVVAVAGVANRRGDYAEAHQYTVSLLLEGMWEIIKRKRAEGELLALNEQLEARVQERTIELASKNIELARLNKVFVGRELRMVELKKKIAALESKI